MVNRLAELIRQWAKDGWGRSDIALFLVIWAFGILVAGLVAFVVFSALWAVAWWLPILAFVILAAFIKWLHNFINDVYGDPP